MATMNTFAVAKTLPGAFALPDVCYIENNRRKAVVLHKAGDRIDLTKVDVKQFVSSSTRGQVQKMFITGVLASVQQEVPEAVEVAIRQAMTGLDITPTGPLVTPANVVAVAPGAVVGLGHTPGPADDLATSPVVIGGEGVPGLPGAFVGHDVASAAPDAGAVSEIPAAAAVEEAGFAVEPGGKVGAPETDPAPVAESETSAQEGPYASWKDGKDFATQKRYIAESTDTRFLEYVIQNESKQFQKIAKARLAELG